MASIHLMTSLHFHADATYEEFGNQQKTGEQGVVVTLGEAWSGVMEGRVSEQDGGKEGGFLEVKQNGCRPK